MDRLSSSFLRVAALGAVVAVGADYLYRGAPDGMSVERAIEEYGEGMTYTPESEPTREEMETLARSNELVRSLDPNICPAFFGPVDVYDKPSTPPASDPYSKENVYFINGFIGVIPGYEDLWSDSFDAIEQAVLEEGTRDVTLVINSKGGDIDAGYRLLNILDQNDVELTVITSNEAHSLASIMATWEGAAKRIAYEDTTFILHESRYSIDGDNIFADNVRLDEFSSRSLETTNAILQNDYYSASNGAVSFECLDLIVSKDDMEFTALQMLSAGMLDEVWSRDEERIYTKAEEKPANGSEAQNRSLPALTPAPG